MSGPAEGLTHKEIEELLGVYALDAVDPETAAAVEAHLETCVRCAAEVGQYHEVTGLLANSGGTAPVDLWDGIAAQIGGASDQSWDRLAARLGAAGGDRVTTGGAGGERLAPVVPIRSGRRLLATGAALVAAAAAVIAVALGVQVHHLHTQVSALQSSPQLSAAERAALDAPSTRKIPLASPPASGPVHTPATVVLTAAGTGFVVDDGTDGLAPLPADRTYQLWAVVGSKAISLGLLGAHPGVVPFSAAGGGSITAFAITDEAAGGVVTSANRPVAAGTVHV